MYLPQPEEDYLDAAMLTVLQIHEESPPGDVLVFLTGQEEIDSLARLLRDRSALLPFDASPLLVAPLYAALPPEQQMAVFAAAPGGSRKVVLATNIAETSLTLPGVRYVVDPGLAKQRAFNPRSGVDTLAVAPISQAAARQRAGRAGREAPGICYRLYTEESFHGLAGATRPEILRANLGGVVLQLKALGVQDVLSFPLLDPPPRAALLRSLELLYALGALEDSGSLSSQGAAMARFPLEPSAAKALMGAQAEGEGCCEDCVAVLGMLSVDAVFFIPREREAEARAAKARFASPDGDHVTLLRVFRAYSACPARQRGDWCRDHFVSARALSRATDVADQLRRGVPAAGGLAAKGARGNASASAEAATFGEDSAPLRRALTSGFFLQAASRQPDGSYRTLVGGQIVAIHPSSVLFKHSPPHDCILYNELVRTTKLYVRDVSAIDTAWLAELAPRFYGKRDAMQPRGAAADS